MRHERGISHHFDVPYRELQAGLARARLGCLFGGGGFASLSSFSAFATFSGLRNENKPCVSGWSTRDGKGGDSDNDRFPVS